jgi:hypothetical protein
MMSSDETLQIGKQVHPNELLMVLPDTSEMVAAVRVHESFAGRIQPGMAATIRIDAVPNAVYNGKIASIGVLAESGGWRDPNLREYTVRVNIEADNAEQTLKPSMRSEARLVLGTVEDALAVPIQAVFREGRSQFVYKPRGSKFERTEVKVGRRSSTFVEVATGLKEGDRVLLREPEPGEILRRGNEKPAEEPALAGAPGATGAANAAQAGRGQGPGAGNRANRMTPEQMREAMKNMTPEQRQAMMKNAKPGEGMVVVPGGDLAKMHSFKAANGENGGAADSTATQGETIEVTEGEFDDAWTEEGAGEGDADSGTEPAPEPAPATKPAEGAQAPAKPASPAPTPSKKGG